MIDHASAFRVAAPFLSVTAIPHLTHRIGGTAASARVQSTVLRILFGSIVLIGRADSSLEGNTGAFFSMIGVGDLVQQGVKDLVGSSVSMALARS